MYIKKSGFLLVHILVTLHYCFPNISHTLKILKNNFFRCLENGELINFPESFEWMKIATEWNLNDEVIFDPSREKLSKLLIKPLIFNFNLDEYKLRKVPG